MDDSGPRDNAPLASVAALCAAATAGDSGALQVLLARYHAEMLAFARRKVGVDWRDKIDAEDVLQEAYVDVFDRIGEFRYSGEDSFYAWALRIVDHRFIDQVRYWRARKRDAAREVQPMPAEASRYDAFVHRCLAGLLSPSIAARRAEAVGAIMACLAHMTEDYRRVLQRLHLDQAEVAEVAAEMGRTPDAVRRLAGRALEALRTELGNASRYFESRG